MKNLLNVNINLTENIHKKIKLTVRVKYITIFPLFPEKKTSFNNRLNPFSNDELF